MPFKVSRDNDSNALKIAGSTNPLHVNKTVTAEVDALDTDTVNVINSVGTEGSNKTSYEFYSVPYTEFTDSDVVSLICPRPLLIQHGKKDRIAHWPQVVEEFELSKTHYEKLGLANRIELDLHEGGHESLTTSGIRFMNTWLKE